MTKTSTATSRTAPLFIERDTHAGKHWRNGIPKGFRTDVFEAREIADFGPAGVIWEVQMIDGRPVLFRARYVASEDGSITLYKSSGARSIIHPADRKIRILTK